MEEKAKIETIIQDVRHYLETRMQIFMLDTSEKASSVMSSVASILLLAVCLIFVLLFLSIGAAIWIGHSFGEPSMGFLLIGLFYLVVGIVLYAGRKSIIKAPIVNSVLNTIYTDEKH